jgi:hypothetical protein
MMFVALILFVAVILACLVAPNGERARKPAPAVAKQASMQVGEARA